MSQNKGNQTTKNSFLKQINNLEALKNNPNINDNLDHIFGNFSEQPYQESQTNTHQEKKQASEQRQEFSIFSYRNYYETEVVKKQIKELTEQVKKEIAYIKKADTGLANNIADIEKLTIESLPEKPGIYHIRFLEIILRILKSLREKIGESRTWLTAMISRKKKRGSLFLSLSKKKGTQYSLSQELTTARSVQ